MELGVLLAVAGLLLALANWVSEKFLKHLLAYLSFITHIYIFLDTIQMSVYYLPLSFVIFFSSLLPLNIVHHSLVDAPPKPIREWLSLMSLTLFVFVLARLGELFSLAGESLLNYFLLISVSAVLALHYLAYLHLKRYQPKDHEEPSTVSPTVSLLIPARNEDHALQDALHEAVQSNYDKLEILVLDDCSHDKTPSIIRSFAKDGVRFVEGQPINEGWLGKNHALQQLAIAANGQILIFCDVDVQIESDTVEKVVNTLEADKLDMAAFLPSRRVFDIGSTLLRPLTEFWLTILPFQLTQAKAALGVCYAVRAETLNKLNRYEDVKSEIFPEFTFAKRLEKIGRYKFFFGRRLGITTRKKFSSQEASSIRTLYPAHQKDLTLVTTTLLLALGLIILPVYFVQTSILAVVSTLLWNMLYARVIYGIHGKTAWLAVIQFPVLIIHEGVLLVVSTVKYRFSEVVWKKRNVCIPVLEVTPSLPKLD